MDPNATWKQIQEAIAEERWLDADNLYGDLDQWVNKRRGFPPAGVSSSRLHAVGILIRLTYLQHEFERQREEQKPIRLECSNATAIKFEGDQQ